MKTYHLMQPEVIVGLGEKTEFLEQTPPFKTVLKLHIKIEDWLGDDLMECHPCYIVTKSLKESLEKSSFTGFKFLEFLLTKDEYFDNNYQLEKTFPKLYWMKIDGMQDVDSLYCSNSNSIFASNEFIEYLKSNFTTNYLGIDPERNEFDDLLDKMISESKKMKLIMGF